MKSKKPAALCIALCLLLSGCGAQTARSFDDPETAPAKQEQTLIAQEKEEFEKREYEETPIGKVAFDKDKLDAYLEANDLSDETAEKKAGEIESAVKELLARTAKEDYSQMQFVLAVYHTLASHVTYDLEDLKPEYCGIVGALTAGRSDNAGFAWAAGCLFDQAGLETSVVSAFDGDRLWNRVNIDGYDYHIDIASEAEQTQGQCYRFFGLTDRQMRLLGGADEWTGTDGEAVPECRDRRFEYLNALSRVTLDIPGKALYTIDGSGDGTPIAVCDFLYGDKKETAACQAESIAFWNGKVYFSDTTDALKLKTWDPGTRECAAAEDTMANRIMESAKGLIVFNDVQGTKTVIEEK